MAYEKINWKSGKIGGTLVNSTNLNKMDKGIYDNSIDIENIKEKNAMQDELITELQNKSGGGADLSNYYTKEEVDAKIPNLENYALKSEIPSLENYALKSEIPDVSEFQTEVEVTALINEAIGGIENGSY